MSEKTKFSGGEWVVEHGSVFIVDGCKFEMMSKHDANLIKKAKDLYEMLDDLSGLMGALDEHCAPDVGLGSVKLGIDSLLADARGE